MAKNSILASASYTQILQLWQTQNFEPELINHHSLLQQNPVLETVLNAGPSLTVIMETRSSKFIYVTRNCEQILGYSADELLQKGMPFGLSLIHPEDISEYAEVTKTIWEFLLALPSEKRSLYKTSTDFRIKTGAGSYKRVLQQNTALQIDSAGNILLLLMVFTDITHLKKDQGISAAIISTQHDGYLVWDAKDTHLKKQIAFSKREREIIKLLTEGFSSKQIADRLFLSEYTVSTHRRNMLDKTQLPNARALINYAINHGMIY